MSNKRGGSRLGSGRKKKEPTKTISFRVPITDADRCSENINKLLKETENFTK